MRTATERSRPRRRAASLRVAAPVLVALALLAGFALALRGLPRDEPRAVRPRSTPVQPLFGGSLDPGKRYGTRFLVPAMTFRVDDDRWFIRDAQQPNRLALERREGQEVPGGEVRSRSFLVLWRMLRVYDPGRPGLRRSLVRAPRDIAAWLRRHPDLRVGRREPLEVAGAKGERFDMTVAFTTPRHPEPACRPFGVVCSALAPDAFFRRGTRIRAIVLDLADGPFLITTEAPDEAKLRELLPRAQAVLDSVRFVTRP